MKRFTRAAAVAALMFTAPAWAQKIAVLGVEEALLTSKAASSFREELKKSLPTTRNSWSLWKNRRASCVTNCRRMPVWPPRRT